MLYHPRPSLVTALSRLAPHPASFEALSLQSSHVICLWDPACPSLATGFPPTLLTSLCGFSCLCLSPVCSRFSTSVLPLIFSSLYSWRGKWQPRPVFLPGETHGQRSLAGYSPWGYRVRHNWSTVTHSLLFLSVCAKQNTTENRAIKKSDSGFPVPVSHPMILTLASSVMSPIAASLSPLTPGFSAL